MLYPNVPTGSGHHLCLPTCSKNICVPLTVWASTFGVNIQTSSRVRHERSLFSSLLDYRPACADCGLSSGQEPLEGPLPSFHLLRVYPQALLLNLVPRDILPRTWTMLLVLITTSMIVAAGIGIVVAQTIIISDSNSNPFLQNNSASSGMPKPGSCCIVARSMCIHVRWQTQRPTG
jgi:uncharacterized protein (DUF983 family)